MLHLSHAIINPKLISIISATNEEMVYKAEGCLTKIPMTNADLELIKKNANLTPVKAQPILRVVEQVLPKQKPKKIRRGRDVKHLLIKTGTTIQQFSELTKIKPQTVSNWARNPKIAISEQFWSTVDAASEILTEQRGEK